MIRIEQAHIAQDESKIKELFWEYLTWANSRLNEEFKIDFDIKNSLKEDMEHLEKYFPPAGQLFLAYEDNQLAGIACMKKLTKDTAEIKRMYVRHEYRGKGLGKQLLESIIQKAYQQNFNQIRLDTTLFMKQAQSLYRSMGFRQIEPYPESEIPSQYHEYWIFMEKKL